MQVEFTKQELERLLNYLASRPWGEVNPVIAPLLAKFEAHAEQQQQQDVQSRLSPRELR